MLEDVAWDFWRVEIGVRERQEYPQPFDYTEESILYRAPDTI